MSSDSFHWIQEMMMMSFGSIIYDGQHNHPGVDLFLQNVKLQGVVIRKSKKRQKASVLVKKEACSEQTGWCDK